MTLAEKWLGIYMCLGALHIHDGNPKRPHAILHSGKHSNQFANSGVLSQHPRVLCEAANDLIACMIVGGLLPDLPDRVVGPAMGAITLAHELARIISSQRDRECLTSYAEKVTDQAGTVSFNRNPPQPGEKVIVCEDVITKGESAMSVITAVQLCGAAVIAFVPVLVNRSSLTDLGVPKIISLTELRAETWNPQDCPLCAKGSQAIKPKSPASNWERLIAKY